MEETWEAHFPLKQGEKIPSSQKKGERERKMKEEGNLLLHRIIKDRRTGSYYYGLPYKSACES